MMPESFSESFEPKLSLRFDDDLLLISTFDVAGGRSGRCVVSLTGDA